MPTTFHRPFAKWLCVVLSLSSLTIATAQKPLNREFASRATNRKPSNRKPSTRKPTPKPTVAPTATPTQGPSENPTENPSTNPSTVPTELPSQSSTFAPTNDQSPYPTNLLSPQQVACEQICPSLTASEICFAEKTCGHCVWAQNACQVETKWQGYTEIAQTHVVRAVGEARHAPKVVAEREAELLFFPTLNDQPNS